MRDLSLHILDLAENSVRAEANLLQIFILEEESKDLFTVILKDDGKGMEKSFLEDVTNPFQTTRTTRKVGLGIPLMKDTCERAGGSFTIESEIGVGTEIRAIMKYRNIDRPPLGNIIDTLISLVMYCDKMNLEYTHVIGESKFFFDTKVIKGQLAGVPMDTPEVLAWVREYLTENINDLRQ